MFVIEFSIFDDLSKSLDFITMETNAINTLNDRLHRMTSQDLHPLAIQEAIQDDEAEDMGVDEAAAAGTLTPPTDNAVMSPPAAAAAAPSGMIAGDHASLELDSVAVDWVHWRLGKNEFTYFSWNIPPNTNAECK